MKAATAATAATAASAATGASAATRLRVFLAVFPGADAQQAAASAAKDFARVGDGIDRVARDQLHFTLRFLGDVSALEARAAGEAMQTAAATIAPFGAQLGGFAAFPSARQARVVWIGLLQGSEPMRRLASALDAALAKQHFPAPEQEFEPHLSIGRVREPADLTARLIAAPRVEARFQVDHVYLVKSTAAKQGALYEPLASARLSG